MVEVAERVAGHHYVHLRGAHQEGVEIRAKKLVGRVVGQLIADAQELLGVLLTSLDLLLGVEDPVQVVEGLDEEAARAACRVQQPASAPRGGWRRAV